MFDNIFFLFLVLSKLLLLGFEIKDRVQGMSYILFVSPKFITGPLYTNK